MACNTLPNPSSNTTPPTISKPPAAALQVSTSSLPGLQVQVAYSGTLAAIGGTTPYSWSLVGGQLPSGLSLSSSGTISGTPTLAGTFSFTVQVRDNAGQTASALLSINIASQPVSGVFYVATNGSDSNPGTLSQPWRTIAKAANMLQPGQTVYIRGGTYNEQLSPPGSGSAGNYITFAAYPGETPVLNVTSGTAVDLNSRSYIVVDGLTLNCNFSAGWMQASGTNHLIIRNNKFNDSTDSSDGVYANVFSYNQFLNNVFSQHGRGTSFTGNDGFLGQTCDHNLFEGNRHINASHAAFQLRGSQFNVIRNNYFENQWGQAGEIHDMPNSNPPAQYNLWEGNTFYAPNKGIDGIQSDGVEFAARYEIIRKNIFRGSQGAGLGMTGYQSTGPYESSANDFGNRVYNNVFYANGKQFSGLDAWDQGRGGVGMTCYQSGLKMDDNVFYNNAFYRNTQNGSPAQVYLLDWGGCSLLANTKWQNNSLFGTGAGQTVIRYWASSIIDGTLSDWQSKYPGAFSNNIEALPQFVDEATLDFHLRAGSPLIDAGRLLTATTAAGSGTVVPVADAKFFTDGYGIAEGDTIVIGSNAPVKIVGIDHVGSKLVVDRSIAWAVNDKVSLPYSGSAPDIGAFEFSVP